MKYVFVDDGYPEANDYANNYVPVPTETIAVCGSEGVRVPIAVRPAWWTAMSCILRVMVPGERGPAGRPPLRVAYEI